MNIEHIAVWAKDIETLKSFYKTYFDAVSNDKYVNTRKGF
ncbi:MAG: glyoxalase, partial [Chloroflexota bacterium]